MRSVGGKMKEGLMNRLERGREPLLAFKAPFALDAGEQMNRMEMKVCADAAHFNDGSVPRTQCAGCIAIANRC